MKNGVLYYVEQEEISDFTESIKSLRKFFSGNVKVYFYGDNVTQLLYLADTVGFEYQILKLGQVIQDLLRVRGLLYTPFQNTLFARARAIFRKDISPLFDLIAQHSLVVFNSQQIPLGESPRGERLEKWAGIYPNYRAVIENYQVPLDLTLVGFTNDQIFLKNWINILALGVQKGLESADCDSLQLLVPFRAHYLAPKEETDSYLRRK